MGGGGKYPYPQWVYSYYGGWWPNPTNYVRNSLITLSTIGVLSYFVGSYSASLEVRTRYPDRWIPSMLWAKEFHDPEFKKQWQEQLKKEGREWIEPIPSW
ncbi:hypothetical protein HK098_006091, partial [Nowakowskiella sp. JEL0407]